LTDVSDRRRAKLPKIFATELRGAFVTDPIGCILHIGAAGDHEAAVRSLADALGVERFEADVRPDGKLARLEALAKAGRRTFMVGDGLNDAPALAAAHVSMAPSSAVDVGRNAADFVFMRDGLEAVPFAFTVARRARRLIRENFALAVLYQVRWSPYRFGEDLWGPG